MDHKAFQLNEQMYHPACAPVGETMTVVEIEDDSEEVCAECDGPLNADPAPDANDADERASETPQAP